MQYQWYPGHMAKAKRQMQEDLKLIDVLIELVDARAPYSSKNPDIDTMAAGKARVLLLNKSDLADQKRNEEWKTYYENQGYYVVLADSKTGGGIKGVRDMVAKACQAKRERDRRRGILNRPIRAMVTGIPNVGKSTFINTFAGRSVTKTGNRPGVTKGKQWIRLDKDVELLDTPGILWPKFEGQNMGLRVALIGSINSEILLPVELAYQLCQFLADFYPGMMAAKYGIEECNSKNEMLSQIAEKRACLLKGGNLDMERAANLLLDDFRNGRIGNFTLEWHGDKDEMDKDKVKGLEMKKG